MTRSMLLIACLVLAGLVLGGCVKGIPQENARSRCLTWNTGATLEQGAPSCLEQEEICVEYFPGQGLAEMDRAQCLAHCDEVKRAQRKLHPADGCDVFVRKGWELCRSHCSSKE